MILHAVTWIAMVLYYELCVDISIMGFFRNIISGHSPMCHVLLSIGYNGTVSIYNLLSGIVLSGFITQLVNQMFEE